MKFLLSLAWKNLFRHGRRTLITAIAIAVGLSVYIFMDSWLLGAEKESERNLIVYETASAQIMNKRYFLEGRDNFSLNNTISGYSEIIASVQNAGYEAAPRTTFNGEIIVYKDPFPEDGSMMVKIEGIDPAADKEVFDFSKTIIEGRYLEQDEDSVLIGSRLAEKLGAKTGYPMLIKTKTKTGYFQTINVKIAGIFDCPNPIVNKTTVLMPLAAADYYLEMDGTVTSVAVRSPFRADEGEVVDRIKKFADTEDRNLTVAEWKTLAPDYVAIAETKRSGSGIMLFLVFIIAAVGITNTMLMAVFERIKEIGMMRALGMSSRQIRRAFLLEAGGIGLIGSVIGTAFGIGITALLVYKGIDISFILQSMDVGYRISGMSYGAWHPAALAGGFTAGILMSVAAAYIPTRRALKWEITECLRHQ